jgi:hypothetical protein
MREATTFQEHGQPINLTVKTKCPEKYLLIDRETGNIFVGNFMGHWDRLDSVSRDS